MRVCCVLSRYAKSFDRAQRLFLELSTYGTFPCLPKVLKLTFSCVALDIETSGEETKVRLRWHEHWPTHHSSKETEEEVIVPT